MKLSNKRAPAISGSRCGAGSSYTEKKWSGDLRPRERAGPWWEEGGVVVPAGPEREEWCSA